MKARLIFALLATSLPLSAHDLVIANGRVMDPASGLDAVRHIGITGGKISAISEMSRRSRAVRLSVFGSDQGNLMQVLQAAQKTQPFQVLPEYNIRGTVSQFDEDVQRRSSSLGLVAEKLGFRLGNDSRFSVLAFDAAMVRTDSLTLVPGVSSKNTTVVAKRATSAGDGQGRVLGVGAVFAFEAARAEGNAQAARNMIELAAVELPVPGEPDGPAARPWPGRSSTTR